MGPQTSHDKWILRVANNQIAKNKARVRDGNGPSRNGKCLEEAQERPAHIGRTVSVESGVAELAHRWKAAGIIKETEKYQEAIREGTATQEHETDGPEENVIRVEDVLNVRATKLRGEPDIDKILRLKVNPRKAKLQQDQDDNHQEKRRNEAKTAAEAKDIRQSPKAPAQTPQPTLSIKVYGEDP